MGGHIADSGVKDQTIDDKGFKRPQCLPGGRGSDDVVPCPDEAIASPLVEGGISSDEQKYSQRSKNSPNPA